MTVTFTWTDERVELLKKLWSDGLSASQIATELGGVTRNAVIGKVHRLGLSGRAKAPPQPRPAAPRKPVQPRPQTARPMSHGNLALKAENAPAPRPAPQPVVYDLSEPPLVENASVLDLTEQTCRWPVGDPSSSGFHFCARKKNSGIPYCAYHARIAYQPVTDRRRDKRAVGY